jgi:hypothetical protein
MSPSTPRSLALAVVACASLAQTGCLAGVAKGVTEAFLESRPKKVDTRQCYIQGPAFEGLESYMDHQDRAAGESPAPVLKVLMVHGIGSHKPGYATRLGESLARHLGLDRVAERYKEFWLENPNFFPGEQLGSLRVRRFRSRENEREMLFYELTWDSIVEEEKQDIAFDNSGEYSFRRTGLNNLMKGFVNETVPDVMMYQGSSGERIQVSVSSAMCFMFSYSWDSLPDGGNRVCATHENPENFLRYVQDDYAFITHSLGSRVTTDSLQRIARQMGAETDPVIIERMRGIRGRRIPVFMLSNQLPLLQLGQELPEVAQEQEAICSADAPRRNERLFDEINLVAFSDPNDLLSYAIPPGYVDKHIDSRMCPSVVNVIINVAEIIDLLGLGQVANPASAHLAYETDERVLALVTNGIGNEKTSPIVRDRCEWVETF